jgi:hypothetical protein
LDSPMLSAVIGLLQAEYRQGTAYNLCDRVLTTLSDTPPEDRWG